MAQVTFVAASTKTGSSFGTPTVLVIDKPTGTVDGDLLIAHFQSSGGAGGTIATLSGWTLKDSNTANNYNSYIFYKVASSEPSTYSWSTASVGGNQSTCGAIIALRNADTANPFSAQSKNADTVSDTTAVGTAITPTKSPEALLIAFTSSEGVISITHSAYAVANNNPSWTEAYDINASGGAPGYSSLACAYGVYDFITTTGAYSSTLSASTTSTTYLVSVPSVFNFAGAFTLTDTVSAQESGTYTPATSVRLTLTDAISATVAQGVSAILNVPKHVSSWLNLDKS